MSSDLNMQSSQSFNDYQEDIDYEIGDDDLGNQITDENITFIQEEDVLKEREKMIQEAIEKLCLERPEAILAMINFEWNIDCLDSWYDDDVDKNRAKAGIELSPKTKELLKQQNVPVNGDYCLTCFEEKNDTFFSLSCGHQFCGDCWTEYLKEKLKNPLGALSVKCQQIGCTCIVPEEVYKKFFANNKVILEKIDKAIFKNFINRNEDLKQCPNPKCHFYAKSRMHSAREINCICGTIYCFKCSQDSHRPCSCEMFERWLRLNDSTKNDDKWIEANTKECPHCHQKIEKSIGCNYMLCNKSVGGCGHAFCYVCETDWAKHSQDHFKCNKYTEAVKNKEKKANKMKDDLKRLDFYFNLYMNNKRACEVLDTKTRNEIEEKINLIVSLKNLPILETKFIIEAINTTIKGKRVLKNTYIFGYYMKDEKKPFFEHEQGILQYWTEELHRHLIDEQLNNIIQEDRYTEFTNKFKDYKNSVNNIIGSILKYSKGLIDDIENNFIAEIDNKLLYQ